MSWIQNSNGNVGSICRNDFYVSQGFTLLTAILVSSTIQQSGKFLSKHGLHCERQSQPCQKCSLMNGGHGDWIGKMSFSEDHETHPDTFSHVCKKNGSWKSFNDFLHINFQPLQGWGLTK